MQICPDPLDAVRCVGPNEQWCVSLPTCYPTIIPFVPNNGQTTANITPFNSGFNNYESGDILDSLLCANSQLIQRIRHKVDLYQTPSSNDAHQILERLTNIVKQHVPNFVFKEIVDGRERVKQSNQNIRQDVIPTPSSVSLQSKSPSSLQQIINRKKQDEHVLSKDSSHHSRLTNNSLHSANISTLDIRTNKDSNQISPIQNLQSLSSTTNEKGFERKDSQVHSPISSDHNNRDSIVISIPAPSISATPLLEQQPMTGRLRQVVHNMMSTSSQHNDLPSIVTTSNIRDQHLDSTHPISAIDLKNSSFHLSPSHNKQRVDRLLSPKPTISTIQSPISSTDDLEQQELLTQSSASLKSQYSDQSQQTLVKSKENKYHSEKKSDYQHRSLKVMHKDKGPEKRSSWIRKLVQKMSSKRLNTASFQDIPKENSFHKKLSDQNRTSHVQLHMAEAMDALKLDLTKEAFQALINKKKDFKQNGLMHILTAPARCCRSCRTQRRLATVAQRSIDIAIKNI